jgi:hypothetical protein
VSPSSEAKWRDFSSASFYELTPNLSTADRLLGAVWSPQAIPDDDDWVASITINNKKYKLKSRFQTKAAAKAAVEEVWQV